MNFDSMAEVDTEKLIFLRDSRYCVVAMMTLFVYEHIRSAIPEVIYGVWKRPTRPNILYAVTNVLTFVYLTLHTMLLYWRYGCRSAYRLAVAAACIGSALFLIYGVIAALRVYAITGRSYIVPSIIICLFLGGIIARIFYSLHLYAVPNLAESTQCVVASGLPSENVKFEIILRVFNMGAETLALAVSLRHQFCHVRLAQKSARWRTLPIMLLKDGIIHCSVLFAFNLVAVVMYTTGLQGLLAHFLHAQHDTGVELLAAPPLLRARAIRTLVSVRYV